MNFEVLEFLVTDVQHAGINEPFNAPMVLSSPYL